MTAPLPLSEADAVVIGAGAFGYATAYFLGRHGAGRVALLDKATPGDGSSARAAGLFKMVQADEVMTRLSHRSAAIVRGFAAETGVAIPHHDSGSILAARGAAHAPLIRAEIAQSRGWGVELEVIDAAGVRRLAPWLDGEPFDIAVHVPGDMYVEEPPSVLEAFHRAAEALGVAILGDAPISAILAE
ncbi:MAG: FAD-dependent oxidoreductase, partial [Gemmataceae bacterium]|nr:FAD-dependent oxidoreductase [Gemmataceae bacterium]